MNKSAASLLILCIIIIGGYITIRYFQNKETTLPEVTTPTETLPEGEPTFTWTYIYTDTKEIPETRLDLTATYPNGVQKTKTIDTVEGSCNAYDVRDKDVYEKSEMVICYYAGLGHYYKIVRSDTAYLVQRRIFEEASPDYNPPKLPFETIVSF